MSLLIFICNAEIDYPNKIPGRLSGINLSETGEKNAKQVAHRLRDVKIDRIFSSPMERAFQTALPLAKQQGVDISVRNNLTEIDFGTWTGSDFDTLEKQSLWKQYNSYRNGLRIPGGELLIEVQMRMVTELEKITSNYPDNTIALVSHSEPIKTAIAYYTGIPLELFLHVEIATASISVVSLHVWGAQVLTINNTGSISAG